MAGTSRTHLRLIKLGLLIRTPFGVTVLLHKLVVIMSSSMLMCKLWHTIDSSRHTKQSTPIRLKFTISQSSMPRLLTGTNSEMISWFMLIRRLFKGVIVFQNKRIPVSAID